MRPSISHRINGSIPHFELFKLNLYVNTILTGFIWAGWHVPYYLHFLARAVLQAHTPLRVPDFIPVAARLCSSEGTLRNLVDAIFAKLNVIDRIQAAVLACMENRSRLTISPVFTQ